MSVRYVKIYYGPCDSFNSVELKPQKLKGLVNRLQILGFRVDLAPVEFVNYCVIEMCGHEIFRCNIQNLKFNTSYSLDPVCQRAVAAVVASSDKFLRARNYLWFWTLIDTQLFTRSQYAPKNHWPTEFTLESYQGCLDCIKCCGILAFPKK